MVWVAWVCRWRGSNFGVGDMGSVDPSHFGVDSLGRNFGVGGVGLKKGTSLIVLLFNHAV